jgi:uncharacterized protein Usg
LRVAFKGSHRRTWQQSASQAANLLAWQAFLLPGRKVAGILGSTVVRTAKRERKMSELDPRSREYRLTTAEIIYHLPDHPGLLQSFVWQHLDVAPEYPNLRRFLDFWSHNIEGKLHSVRVGQAKSAGWSRFRHIVASHRLH